MKLISYRLKNDRGFAPNPYFFWKIFTIYVWMTLKKFT